MKKNGAMRWLAYRTWLCVRGGIIRLRSDRLENYGRDKVSTQQIFCIVEDNQSIIDHHTVRCTSKLDTTRWMDLRHKGTIVDCTRKLPVLHCTNVCRDLHDLPSLMHHAHNGHQDEPLRLETGLPACYRLPISHVQFC